MKKSTTIAPDNNHDHEEQCYSALLLNVSNSIRAHGHSGAYKTDAKGLYGLFLSKLPEDRRQVYQCSTCRRFVEEYGGLVSIDEQGKTTAIAWQAPAPDFFEEAVLAVRKKVQGANVTGVFRTSKPELGTPVTGPWRHLSSPSYDLQGYKAVEYMRRVNEGYGVLRRAVSKYSIEAVKKAIAAMEGGHLGQEAKQFAANARLLYKGLLVPMSEVNGTKFKQNLIMRFAASAPNELLHINSTVLGTILEQFEAGQPLTKIRLSIGAITEPTVYQRPQAPPSEGNIDVAEKLIASMGLESALKRRFARVDEVRAIWRPEQKKETQDEGVFGSLRGAKNTEPKPTMPDKRIQFADFIRNVLPEAKRMRVLVPHTGPFAALTTAVDHDAKPIFWWDKSEDRYPVAYYTYAQHTPAEQWKLKPLSLVEVTAVVPAPNEKQDEFKSSFFFLLDGAVDTRKGGLALFPSFLIDELRPVRATIEAFSNKGELEGAETASACGLGLNNASQLGLRVFVETEFGVQPYTLVGI